jgi:hypothetical protein
VALRAITDVEVTSSILPSTRAPRTATVSVGAPLRDDDGGSTAVKDPKQRTEEKRREKLEQIEEQVRDGTLVIRQMTDAERERDPPRPPKENRPRRRYD